MKGVIPALLHNERSKVEVDDEDDDNDDDDDDEVDDDGDVPLHSFNKSSPILIKVFS